MTIMHVEYLGNLRTQATHADSGAKLLSDAPKDNQGEGQSFSPTDLLATSLASCMLTIMGIKARVLNVDLKGVQVVVEKIMQASPRKVSEIKVTLKLAGLKLDPSQLAALQEAAMTCPVFLSLDPAMKKTVSWT